MEMDTSTGDEDIVTMVDVLREQEEIEENANAVLGSSDDQNCTYTVGYIKRQALFACLTCNGDSQESAGICLACSLKCHNKHELVELYTKRNFRCDCSTKKFPDSHFCSFSNDKNGNNKENKYNQNFTGLYCICSRPYPDPENPDPEKMIQCVICEDWLHSSHLEARVPNDDQYSEMICKGCMVSNDFLYDYTDLMVDCPEEDSNESLDVSIPALGDIAVASQEPDKDDNFQPAVENEMDIDTECKKSDPEINCAPKDMEKPVEKDIVSDTMKNSVTEINMDTPAKVSSDEKYELAEKDIEISETKSVEENLQNKTHQENETESGRGGILIGSQTKEQSKHVGEISESLIKSLADSETDDLLAQIDAVCGEEPLKTNDDNSNAALIDSQLDNKDLNVENKEQNKNDLKENEEPLLGEKTEITEGNTVPQEQNVFNTRTLTGANILEEYDNSGVKEKEGHLVSGIEDQESSDQQENMVSESIPEVEELKFGEVDEMRGSEGHLVPGNEDQESSDQQENMLSENIPEVEELKVAEVDEMRDSDVSAKKYEESENSISAVELENKCENIASPKNINEANQEEAKSSKDYLEDPDDAQNKYRSHGDDSEIEPLKESPNVSTDKISSDMVPTEESSKESDAEMENTKHDSNDKADNIPNSKEQKDEIETPDCNTNVGDEMECDQRLMENSIENPETLDHQISNGVLESEPDVQKEPLKRKLSDTALMSPKKIKMEKEVCLRPKRNHVLKPKGATFWPCNWRTKLCSCHNCVTMYRDLDLIYLLDPDDTVLAYEEKGRLNEPKSQYEQGLQAFQSQLDRTQQINALTEYNKMKEKLLDFFKGFKEKEEVVKEEDIKKFFEDMKPKRKDDGVYFCI